MEEKIDGESADRGSPEKNRRHKAMVHPILCPGTHYMKVSSSLGARRHLGQDATNSMQPRGVRM